VTGLLVSGIVASVVSTIALFGVELPSRVTGRLAWTRRLVVAVFLTATVAAMGGLGALMWSGHPRRLAVVLMVVLSVVWLPATRRWNGWAHVCWVSNLYLFVVYLVFMFRWTLHSPLGTPGLIGAFALWGLEALGALLGIAYLWELCDSLGSEHWRRRTPDGVSEPGADRPFVSLHVPAHDEPPEMVIATVRSLLELDYDRYEVVVIDDNTEDAATWRPVEAWCRDHGVTFAHLSDWPGYKSGALNYALRELTDPRAEVIGVVDADYLLDPLFLRRCAPLFADASLGFVQSPQDYRDWQDSSFHRRLFYSYKYFFAISQPSRNERDGAIFAGTMGLIRRSALDSLGGWDEWCITEDAELSLRLLKGGWSGRHVDASYGHGVMPMTFEAFKGQRYRWCFGGIQILRLHWRSMLPGPRHGRNRLRLSQRWAYFSGALQWYGDLFALIFFLFLLAGAVNVAFDGGLLFRRLSFFLIGAIPVLVLLGVVRGIALIRRGTGATWRDALGALLIWQSTSLVVARASILGLFARRAEFLRTPKAGDRSGWRRALTANRGEVVLALAGLVGIAAALTHLDTMAGGLAAALLVLPTYAFLSAPLNSLSARRAALARARESSPATEPLGRHSAASRAVEDR
jgi:cellulose synthase/poly-beta-1,6-N-acetylglucosamine synthase-like glycosyltransferase